MSLLASLERHIPSARALLLGAEPCGSDAIDWAEPEADVVCAFGLSGALYAKARAWLDEEGNRRLVFVEDRPEALARLLQEDDAILLLNDLRVKIHFLETPFQIEIAAKKIAWGAVLLRLKMLDAGRPIAGMRDAIEKIHLAAGLLLSDAADWGCAAARHAKVHSSRPFRSALGLRGSFRGIPAIVVGAGPSLEKNGHLLKGLRGKALIFAGGTALSRIGFAPHFSACIDKDEAPRIEFSAAPLCFQARAKPSAQTSGPRLLAPDAHFSFLNWLAGEEERFDAGWTVGNFCAALAVEWGCDPIVFVGMDSCYSGGKKYAGGDRMSQAGLVEAIDSDGNRVWTQRDWLMAIRWLEELAAKHPERQFFNATEGGMRFLAQKNLKSFQWKEIEGLERRVDEAVSALPEKTAFRWAEWNESLQRCAGKLERMTNEFEGEVVEEELLSPLWNLWRPVFERELDLDPHKISYEEKMRINEILFYREVVKEHLDAAQ